MSRPSKLTPELQAKIVEYIRNGNAFDTSAQACGIHRATAFIWLQKGREGVEGYVDFFDAIERARAEAETVAVEALRKGFAEDWRAAVEWLKRARWANWTTPTSIDPRVLLELATHKDESGKPVEQMSAREKLAQVLFALPKLQREAEEEQRQMVEDEQKLLGEGGDE